MAKKPAASEVKKPVAPAGEKAAATPKTRTAKPGSNPFVTQHPGKPGRSGSGMNMMLRRDPR
ncbi:MAG: hypothetical protein Q8N23_37100 [Archangium sp.]|nr:hypothetical protein [Archangium sp.]MDP3158351.1 hypothetical protein [Archangium sp.]MDP3569558.1 hypothetical protein [Archangium sp.]